MKILIVGLGLIGGSFAKAVKANTRHSVYALDRDEDVLQTALHHGTIDRIGTPDDLAHADLILLALYPAQTVDFIKQHAPRINKQAVVADSCGVKTAVCEAVAPLAERYGFCFIGAHPMAGKEQGGYQNSRADLFLGASFIVTPAPGQQRGLALLESFTQELGFAKFVRTTPPRHDELIAYTSQLPHVLACAYILDENAAHHNGFSAGSFRDVSRVALINEQLWTQLFLENAAPLSEQIGRLCEHLQRLKNLIDTKDEPRLSALLREGRERKERFRS